MKDIFRWQDKSSWSSQIDKGKEDQKHRFNELIKKYDICTENDDNKRLLNRLNNSTEIAKISNNDNEVISCLAHLGEDEFFQLRKALINFAEEELIISGHSLFEGMSSSNNRSIQKILVNRIKMGKITRIKIFLTDIMIFENELTKNCQLVNKVMSTQEVLLRDLFPICEEYNCKVDVFFLPILDIDHVVMTNTYMLYRNTKLWTPDGDLKGEFCLYSFKEGEKGECFVQKKYFEQIAMCCTDIIPEIDSSMIYDDSPIARTIKEWREAFHKNYYNNINLHKLYMTQLLHYVACVWTRGDTQKLSFCQNEIIKEREQLFCPDNLLNDDTQEVLLKYIKETEQQLNSVVKKYDKIQLNQSLENLSGAWIYPSLDLGIPNNVTRLAGGFATGMLVTWRCGTPIVPIDATVNVCSSSVFGLPDSYDINKSSDEFVGEIEKIVNKAAKTGNHFSFDTGNHFLMIAVSKDNKKYLILHSSAKEFKDSYVGLYPSLEGQKNWYSGRYRTSPSPTTPGRYLRYLRGEDAKHFVWLAHKLETVNEQIHSWFAGEIGGAEIRKHNKMEKTTYHHYYMPTDTSIAIGTYVEEPGTTVPIFSAPGKPICLFEIAKFGNWTIDINGHKKCVVPHGWGQEIKNLRNVRVLEGKLQIITKSDNNEDEIISYSITKDKHITINSKCLRNFNSCEEFLNKGKSILKGTIVDELSPVYLYCSSMKGRISN